MPARLMRVGPLLAVGEALKEGMFPGAAASPGPWVTMRGPTPGASGAGWPVGTALSPNKLPKGDALFWPGPWPGADAPNGDEEPGCAIGDPAGGCAAKGDAPGAGGAAEKGETWAGAGASEGSGIIVKGDAAVVAGAALKGLPPIPMPGAAENGVLAAEGAVVLPSEWTGAKGLMGKAEAPGREIWAAASRGPTSARGGGGPWRRGGSSMPLGVEAPASGAGDSIIMPPVAGGVIVPKGETFSGGAEADIGAGAADAPDCAAAIRRGSLDAGSGIMRGSCGETGVWKSAGHTR